MISHISFFSLMRRVMMHISCLLLFTFQIHSQPTLSFNRIGVNWLSISLFVSVKCGDDARLDLTTNNFAIKDNGNTVNQFQLICPNLWSHCSISTALVIDRSYKMIEGNPSAFESAKAAAKAFIDAMDGNNDEAVLLSFNSAVMVNVPMTTDQVKLRQGVNALNFGGSKAVWDAALTSIHELMNSYSQSCKAVILFTDGNDDASVHTVSDVITNALAAQIQIYTIGYGDDIVDSTLQRLAAETGGKFYRTPPFTQLTDVYNKISSKPIQGFNECELKFSLKCPDGIRHNIDLSLQNLSDCPGIDSKTKSYKAPSFLSTLTTNHPNNIICEDDSIIISTEPQDSASYEWYKNGNILHGQTDSIYKILNAHVSDSGWYSVITSSQCGKILSDAIYINVITGTKIIQQPTSQTAQEKQNATFNVIASGQNLTFQWMKDGVNIPGATDSNLIVRSVKKSDEGDYTVEVHGYGLCGKILTSASAHLSVTLTSNRDNVLLPDQPMLYQNYPNPFSSETAISYRVTAGTNMRLELFDLLGRKLATLIDEEQDAGSHTYTFNPEALNLNLKNGVFMCVMHAGKYTLMKQIVLMR